MRGSRCDVMSWRFYLNVDITFLLACLHVLRIIDKFVQKNDKKHLNND